MKYPTQHIAFNKKILSIIFVMCFIFISPVLAQNIDSARAALSQRDYAKAAVIFEQLFKNDKTNEAVYEGYFETLIQLEDAKKAQDLVEEKLKQKPNFWQYQLDLSRVYKLAKKNKKAKEIWENAVEAINGDDGMTQALANSFERMGEDEYAIRVYEKATDILKMSAYSGPLAKLYLRQKNYEKAIALILNDALQYYQSKDALQDDLMKVLEDDPKRITLAQKILIKKINEQPNALLYTELLTWLYAYNHDWDGALIQIRALSAREKDNGSRLITFALEAAKQEQNGIAQKALSYVEDNDGQNPLYNMAKSKRLQIQFLQIKNDPIVYKNLADDLAKSYYDFLEKNPDYYLEPTGTEYASLLAEYNEDFLNGIKVLKYIIEQPGLSKKNMGTAKLQLGDYYILNGEVWEASLLYSQVDKAFREDQLGEEARFKNAKLSYYRGDFAWAQGQLNVLKASTSELIANDALYLSVLITENIGADSNYAPLIKFSQADLLLFQHQYDNADVKLDSILTLSPQHALADDVYMLKSKIALQKKDYEKALKYLGIIIEKYAEDVLGDDAVFKSAEIYSRYLNQPEKAKKAYEDLIINYPGSTYVQEARKRITATSYLN